MQNVCNYRAYLLFYVKVTTEIVIKFGWSRKVNIHDDIWNENRQTSAQNRSWPPKPHNISLKSPCMDKSVYGKVHVCLYWCVELHRFGSDKNGTLPYVKPGICFQFILYPTCIRDKGLLRHYLHSHKICT